MSEKVAFLPFLSGMAALATAERTAMRKLKGEYDTEFVKRIVSTYLICHSEIHPPKSEPSQ